MPRRGVPTSTVFRIEEGLIDPTIHMLERLVDPLEATWLSSAGPGEDRLSLAELAMAWSDQAGRVKIDWTRLRAFVDRIQQNPAALPDAIADPPDTFKRRNLILTRRRCFERRFEVDGSGASRGSCRVGGAVRRVLTRAGDARHSQSRTEIEAHGLFEMSGPGPSQRSHAAFLVK